jgi:hypothetical protein
LGELDVGWGCCHAKIPFWRQFLVTSASENHGNCCRSSLMRRTGTVCLSTGFPLTVREFLSSFTRPVDSHSMPTPQDWRRISSGRSVLHLPLSPLPVHIRCVLRTSPSFLHAPPIFLLSLLASLYLLHICLPISWHPDRNNPSKADTNLWLSLVLGVPRRSSIFPTNRLLMDFLLFTGVPCASANRPLQGARHWNKTTTVFGGSGCRYICRQPHIPSAEAGPR